MSPAPPRGSRATSQRPDGAKAAVPYADPRLTTPHIGTNAPLLLEPGLLVWRLVAAFLVECRREQTRRAYFNDLRAWHAWCTDRELHPLAARRRDVALWAGQLANKPQRSGKAEVPASVACRTHTDRRGGRLLRRGV